MQQLDLDGNAVTELKRRQTKKTDGGMVWEAYEKSFISRYGHPPIRNAKTNAQALALARQVGTETAAELVAYFIGRNDAFYTYAAHPLGMCLVNIQKLITEMRSSNVITMTSARRNEQHDETERAIKSYIAKQENLDPTKDISESPVDAG